MEWLVLIHVLSAIIGVGPTFFGHVLFRNRQTIGELKQSYKLGSKLDFFPKIGGGIAVLSGIALVIWSGMGFGHFWIIASIILYIAIQIVAVGIIMPMSKKMNIWLQETKLSDSHFPPAPQAALLNKVNKLYYVCSALGTLLFIMMILKPVF
ncbi:DUF2269 family protein [Paenibacillus abyssi]|uniref:DUF2269 domain-containing protein n=1 Tax=Paenibacillus abyssi TaxID=1340531 RepID=A0A917G0K2_9BACL|nr:DUF2269 family protein [Paenibacillus abyssi]GGG16706.1 hypothetical protein GCM10010916_36940 [Paenibacillus abyssi]